MALHSRILVLENPMDKPGRLWPISLQELGTTGRLSSQAHAHMVFCSTYTREHLPSPRAQTVPHASQLPVRARWLQAGTCPQAGDGAEFCSISKSTCSVHF